MAVHGISNFSVSKHVFSGGDTLTVNFTLKNQISNGQKTIYTQQFYLFVKPDAVSLNRDNRISEQIVTLEKVNLKYGASRKYSLNFTITAEYADAINQHFADNPRSRALPVWLSVFSTTQKTTGLLPNGEQEEFGIQNAWLLRSRYLPKVEDFMLVRGENGVPDEEGEGLISTLKLSLAAGADASLVQAKLHYAQSAQATASSPYIDLTAKLAQLLAGVKDSAELIEETFSNGSDWDFLLEFGDSYETALARLRVARAFANLHLSGETTGGACFGGFCASEKGKPMLESYYPGYFYRGIHGVNIHSPQEVSTGGRWIDNKPVYTRILELKDAASGQMHSLPLGEGIETAWIDPSASFCVNSNGYVYPVGYTGASGTRAFVADYQRETGNVRAGTFAGSTADIYVKVCYTKAADEPIEEAVSHMAFKDSEDKLFIDADGAGFMTEVY